MSERITCPECEGAKEKSMLVMVIGACESRMVRCFVCRGDGEVPPDYPQRREEGRRMRAERLSAGRSQRDEAQRLGITPMVLSRIEQGLYWHDSQPAALQDAHAEEGDGGTGREPL